MNSELAIVCAGVVGECPQCFERFQSYVPALQMLAEIVALLAVWSVFVRVPSPEEASQAAQPSLELATAQESY